MLCFGLCSGSSLVFCVSLCRCLSRSLCSGFSFVGVLVCVGVLCTGLSLGWCSCSRRRLRSCFCCACRVCVCVGV